MYWCACHELQESSYPYWPGEEGEEMVYGRLTVRLVKVRGHGDIVERKMKVSDMENISNSTTLIVNSLHIISWPKGGLPHTQSIISLMQMLTGVLMKSSSKMSVIMCRLIKTFLPFACFSYTLSPTQ